MLSIAHFVEVGSRSEIKIGGLLKTEVALAKIALVLPWIERNLNASKYAANPFQGQSCAVGDARNLDRVWLDLIDGEIENLQIGKHGGGTEAPPVHYVRFCQCAGSRLPWKQAITASVSSASMTNMSA